MSVKAVQQTESDAMIQRLLALGDHGSQRKLVAQHPLVDWDQIVSTLTDRVRQEVHVSTAEAQRCYERAYPELLTQGDAEGLAAVLSNLSLCYISLNEFAKALDLHQKARQHCEQKGMPILVAYADYNIAYLYFLRGEYGRAIQMLRDAAVSWKRASDA